jgi:hypothetical protein
MQYSGTVALFCENHTKQTDTRTLCEQNAEFWYVKAGGTYGSTGLCRVNMQNTLPLGVESRGCQHFFHFIMN